MMKKRKILLGMSLLAIAGLWTGCSSDDGYKPSDPQAISFHVQGGTPDLRTTATTAASIQAFAVFGSDNLAASNIFNGVTVARQTDGTFDYYPKKYYTVNATSAEFAAFSPITSNVSASTFAFSTGFNFNYAVPVPDPSGSDAQEDLLVAGTTIVPSTAAVALDFQHALSRMFIKATSELNETVTIKRIILRNLYSTGAIAGAPGNPWTWGWTPSGARTNDYEYVLAPSGVSVEANQSTPILVTSMEQGMMLLPQTTVNSTPDDVTAGDFAIEIVYDVGNILDETKYIYLANGYAFSMGTQYAITIDFTGEDLIQINFTISVGTFADDPLTMP
jgi:hypothetical protein